MQDDDSKPATKRDLRLQKIDVQKEMGRLKRELSEDMQIGFQKVHEDMQKGFQKMHEDTDSVLTVLVNVNNRLTGGLENHEKRIRTMENTLGISV